MLGIRAITFSTEPTTKRPLKAQFAEPSPKAVGVATYSKNLTMLTEAKIRRRQATNHLLCLSRTWPRRSPLRPPQARPSS